MKKLHIFIGIVALVCSLNAQNQIDPPKLADYTNTAVFDRTFGQSSFIKGWNWGSIISPTLKINPSILRTKA